MKSELFLTEKPMVVQFSTDYHMILNGINEINPIQYSKTRNFVDGAVTYLSPYISRGVISVKQIQEWVLRKEYDSSKIEKFLQELACGCFISFSNASPLACHTR